MGTPSTLRDSGTHLVTPRKARRKVPRPKAPLGVVGQVRMALRPGNRLAAFLGALWGGFVPGASFWIAHHEFTLETAIGAAKATLVLGGLVFSAKTVFQWTRLAFGGDGWKATGFVVVLEGVMVTSATPWLATVALAYLVCINGAASACVLARPQEK